MKTKKAILGLTVLFLLVVIGFYQYQVSQDRSKKLIYTEDLRFYPKRSFTEEDNFEVVPTGSPLQILRLKTRGDQIDVYLQWGEKRGWVSSLRNRFQVHD